MKYLFISVSQDIPVIKIIIIILEKTMLSTKTGGKEYAQGKVYYKYDTMRAQVLARRQEK